MRHSVIVTVFLAAAAMLAACEKYEKVPENSPFSIEASVTTGSAVAVAITVTDGNHAGDCTLEASIRNASTGAAPSFKVLLNGATEIGPSDTWTFSDDGAAAFTLKGLPKGTYAATFTVRRWYHSASASTTFTVK